MHKSSSSFFGSSKIQNEIALTGVHAERATHSAFAMLTLARHAVRVPRVCAALKRLELELEIKLVHGNAMCVQH